MIKIISFIVIFISALIAGGFLITGCASSFGKLPSKENTEDFKKSKNYDADKGIFVNRRPTIMDEMRKRTMNFSTFKDFLVGGDKDRTPSANLPEVKPDFAEFLKPSEDLKITWFGHSTVLLNIGGKIVLIDPVLSDSTGPLGFMMKRFQKAVINLTELPKIDVVVISHDHYDHLDMDSIKYFADKAVPFVVPLGVGAHLQRWGIEQERIQELDWWQNSRFGDVELTATPAQHFSGRGMWNQNKSLWASWVIKSPKHSVYFSGDSGFDTHFKDIGDKLGPFDIAFVESGQYNEKWREVHLLPEESVQAFKDLKAKRYFPIHWGMFTLAFHSWHEPVDRLAKAAKENGMILVTPKLGELVTVNDSLLSTQWWNEATTVQK
ncbi:MBL fold metallo-hydrolase [Bdellovibrio sp. HCB209]|uniref:MBL fold metallo-hydrolase n=1 Tax=Bdellovibrio sp. HCB209 TaxID=3394354 RepID=UPI0039B449C8